MLERDKKYTDKEIARRKGLLWNGKPISTGTSSAVTP